jgi:hypothetical protein
MAEFATPESKLRFEKEDRFLREVIYAGLTDLNTGFDSPLIGHFSPEDFLVVIDRCEALNVRVIGIEVHTIDPEPVSTMELVQKFAGMTTAQQDARVREIYASPRTPENRLEWIKLMLGEDMSIGEVEGAATGETYLSGTTPRGPMPQTTQKT